MDKLISLSFIDAPSAFICSAAGRFFPKRAFYRRGRSTQRQTSGLVCERGLFNMHNAKEVNLQAPSVAWTVRASLPRGRFKNHIVAIHRRTSEHMLAMFTCRAYEGRKVP